MSSLDVHVHVHRRQYSSLICTWVLIMSAAETTPEYPGASANSYGCLPVSNLINVEQLYPPKTNGTVPGAPKV